MNAAAGPTSVEHRAFNPRESVPLARAQLSDRQKLAVILQTASLASLFDAAGTRLAGSWLESEVDREGLICVAGWSLGRARQPHQSWLLRLLEVVFEAERGIPGRGTVRGLARGLRSYWSGYPTPIQADRVVEDLLEHAPFLWQPPYASVRRMLAGRIRAPQGGSLWVAGPGRFRRQMLKGARTLEALEVRLVDGNTEEIWRRGRGRAESAQLGPRSRAGNRLPTLPSCDGQSDERWSWRRSVSREQAADAWYRLARDRFAQGDLTGADRAVSRSLVLHSVSEPASVWCERQLLSVELRIRRGRFNALPRLLDELDRSVAHHGSASRRLDVALLRARFDLSRGMPAAALGQVAQYRDACDRARIEETRLSRVLEARALGWMGRADDCKALVVDLRRDDWRCLEPEEQAALWALAGDPVRACEAAERGPWHSLWCAVAELAESAWPVESPFERLGDFRGSRLVLDVEMVRPGLVPKRWSKEAQICFRRLGAHAFASRLDRTRRVSWRVLADFLGSSERRETEEAGQLLEQAGYFDTRLTWREQGRRNVLLPGVGGPEELKADLLRGELCLEAERLEAPLKALFAVVAREFTPAERQLSKSLPVRELIGESDELLRSLARLDRLASGEISVLIRGETGTGKELAARRVHRRSSRSGRPFVAVNCAALSESLLLSELFGHTRGAFTGADRSRAGIFESASGGTVFLDEIGDLPLMAQAKLLRVLQQGEVRRLGESLPRSVDVRVVAATHRDLTEMMRRGDFRRDLYYRLCVGRIDLPPLRYRGADVTHLAEHFLSQQGYSMTRSAGRRLMGYGWPGNVRELKNVIDLAMALCDDTVVDVQHLELPEPLQKDAIGYHRQVQDFRRSLVREALRASGGRKAEAARRLNLSRQALGYLARTLGVE